MALSDSQMLAFPLTASSYLQIGTVPVASVIQSIMLGLTLFQVGFLSVSPEMVVSMYAGALAWVVGVLACAIFVGHAFSTESFSAMWPIKVSTTFASRAAPLLRHDVVLRANTHTHTHTLRIDVRPDTALGIHVCAAYHCMLVYDRY